MDPSATVNRASSSRVDGSFHAAEKRLSTLRPQQAKPVPHQLVLSTPIPGTDTLNLSHPFDRAIFDTASTLKGLEGTVIAFDLDDTLLNTNYICKAEWTFPTELGPEPEVVESIDYRRMRHPASYWIKAGWKRPRRRQYDSSRYPFLRDPDVVAQLRPGALALLHGLKSAGATLVLMTICAPQRLEFLFSRLPTLKEAFVSPLSGRLAVVNAQDLAQFVGSIAENGTPDLAGDIDTDMGQIWEGGLRAHLDDPLCFNVKSLPALHAITGLKRLDLLVDDSEKGAESFNRSGLGDHYLKAPRFDPFGLVVPELLARLINRLGLPHTGLDNQEGFRSALENDYPWIRFEDPLYFPFVHIKDTLTPDS